MRRTGSHFITGYDSLDAVVMGGVDPALIGVAGVDLHDYPQPNGSSWFDWFCQENVPLSHHADEFFLIKCKQDRDSNNKVH